MYIVLKRCIGILKEYLGKMRCCVEDKRTSQELEDDKPRTSWAQQDNDVADVSDIDFDAFLSSVFPSKIGR
jgi:hypothetical protein